MQNTEERVKAVIADMFGLDVESLTGESRLAQDLNIKSANRVNLSAQLEEIFQIEINIFEVLKLETLQEVFDLVESKLSA